MSPAVGLVVPALDEAATIRSVVESFVGLRRTDGRPWLDLVVVVDNGSRDGTAERARSAGAAIVAEPRRGYGSACLAGIRYLGDLPEGPPKLVAFADADGSNDPSDLPPLLGPLESGAADMVIGSRAALAVPGSLTPTQRFGNRLATTLLNRIYGSEYTDLGPFRAITWSALQRLGMEDPDYGWTIEMQLKAARIGLTVAELDVHNRPRAGGQSKVAGTVRGVVGAGTKILWSLWRYR